MDRDRGPNWIQTFSGRPFWPAAPHPEDVDVRDIAAHLAKVCRFGGACREFYSVAEHSVLVSTLVPAEHALWGLLHDGAEAYIGDLVRPIKRMDHMYAYRNIEAGILRAIALRFGLPQEIPVEVHTVDDRLLATEAGVLMVSPPARWAALDAAPYTHVRPACLDWRAAERQFLDRFRELWIRG